METTNRFDEVLLEKEQVDLLSFLVEAIRSIPRDKRDKFHGHHPADGPKSRIVHPGLPEGDARVYLGDIEALHSAGLVNLVMLGVGSFKFDVTPRGFKYYEVQQTQITVPIERVDKSIRGLIEGQRFQSAYPTAFDKWAKAEAYLWASDTNSELSTIGHLCREAMQEFATVLVEKYHPRDVDTVPAHHISRLRAVLTYRAKNFPGTLANFLEALLSYWGTLNDLVQRQEHAGQKEGQPVTWEDARRIVFHTAIVCIEIDKALSATA